MKIGFMRCETKFQITSYCPVYRKKSSGDKSSEHIRIVAFIVRIDSLANFNRIVTLISVQNYEFQSLALGMPPFCFIHRSFFVNNDRL